MTWISFVIVTLLFFTPIIGLGPVVVKEQTFALTLVGFSLPRQYTGYISLLLYCVGLWLVLSLALLALEQASRWDLAKARLCPGLIYAVHPKLSNRVAVLLADLVLIYLVTRWALPEIAKRLAPLLSLFLPQLASSLSAVPQFVDAFFPQVPLGLIVLSIFTLVAAYGFDREQQYRYKVAVLRNQLQRKEQQKQIVVR
ncbi:MAG: hypothetical protein FJZ93_04800 [Chloroflexi bacterium]|nr:hypothetical protein [Chloroflexota bacterium]MBM3175034.1 hypothetical protein [Chloroflexota bacterium]